MRTFVCKYQNYPTMDKDINRLKVVLAEKKANQQVVSPTIGQRPRNSVEMVYQHHATQFGNSCRDCQILGRRHKGFTVADKKKLSVRTFIF